MKIIMREATPSKRSAFASGKSVLSPPLPASNNSYAPPPPPLSFSFQGKSTKDGTFIKDPANKKAPRRRLK